MTLVEASRFLGVLAIAAVAGPLLLLAGRDRPDVVAARASAIWLAALVAATATAGSLWLSEGLGLPPCTLCWWQRAAMYPLALLLPLLAWRPTPRGRLAAGALATAGLGVSLWHVAVQHVPALADATACSSTLPCSAALVRAFGVLTIPAMAACGFLAVVLLLTLHRQDA